MIWLVILVICTVILAKAIGDKIMDPLQIGNKANDLKKYLREQGLHKWTMESYEKQYASENPLFFNYQFNLKNLMFAGLADFIIDQFDISLIPQRARFDIVIPKLIFGVGSALLESMIFLKQFKGVASGQIILMEIRINGEVELDMNTEPKSVSNIVLKFSLKAVKSNLKVSLFDVDYSETVNNFLQKSLPSFLETYQNSINNCLEMLAVKTFNEMLS